MAAGEVSVVLSAYLGRLFRSDRRPNALVRLVGGLSNGILTATAKEFPIGVFYNLRAPGNRARLEGAAPPTAEHRDFSQTTNVIQLFQETVETTWLAQSDNSFSGLQIIDPSQPMQDPRDHDMQVGLAFEAIAQDLNYVGLNGAYQNPADPRAAALQTRGILSAITTNVEDYTDGTGGSQIVSAADYRTAVNDLHMGMVQNGSMLVDESHYLFCDAIQFNNVSLAFESKTRAPEDRTVAGFQVRTIYTRFGKLNLVLDFDVPAQSLNALNLSVVGFVGLPVPGKGVLFERPLPESRSADATQIYGQLGIDHGPEWMHGKAINLPAGKLAEA